MSERSAEKAQQGCWLCPTCNTAWSEAAEECAVCVSSWFLHVTREETDGLDKRQARRVRRALARAWDEGYMRGRHPWTREDQESDPIPEGMSPPNKGRNVNPYRLSSPPAEEVRRG